MILDDFFDKINFDESVLQDVTASFWQSYRGGAAAFFFQAFAGRCYNGEKTVLYAKSKVAGDGLG